MRYCWEVKKCSSVLQSKCNAFTQKEKKCWLVTGTMCGGELKDSLAAKMTQCQSCDYYKNHTQYHKI